MTKRVISTTKAPGAVGPYSQGLEATGSMVFVSGQIPLTPAGQLVDGGIEAQTEQCMQNIAAILAEAGLDFSHVVKTVIYLTDLSQFSIVNDTYAKFFDGDEPARACVEVSGLPKGAKIEIDAIAMK